MTPADQLRAQLIARQVLISFEWEFEEYQAGRLAVDDIPVEAWQTFYRGNGPLKFPVGEYWPFFKLGANPGFVQFMEQNVINQ